LIAAKSLYAGVLLAPAQQVIRYMTRVFNENFDTKGPYMGSAEDGIPTDETDALWEDLYQCKQFLHVSHSYKLENSNTNAHIKKRWRQRNQ
jgi:hypothetical protein